MGKAFIIFIISTFGLLRSVDGRDFFINSATGNDNFSGQSRTAPWKTLQRAANVMEAGDTAYVAAGTYGRTTITRSGAAGAPIAFVAEGAPGTVVVSGVGVSANYHGLIHLQNANYVRIKGFTIQNFHGNDISGIRILGSGTGIELLNNRILNMTGTNAMGITVYGTSSTAVSNLLIDGNLIDNCKAYPSEALVVNGNVNGFVISNNTVTNINNIGIDCIGGERSIQSNTSLVARNGLVTGNYVANCLGVEGNAVGIYIDGGSDIVVERNVITNCDAGGQIGAENGGITARRCHFRSNIITKNRDEGLILGAAESSQGRIDACTVTHNLFYQNDQRNRWAAEILIEYATNCAIHNNIFSILPNSPQGFYHESTSYGGGHSSRNNCWFGATGINFTWRGTGYTSYTGTNGFKNIDTGGFFGDPKLVNPAAGDYHIGVGSACIDRALVSSSAGLDIDGSPRNWGAGPDIGPDEQHPWNLWMKATVPTAINYRAALHEDADGDGAVNLLEYAAGTNALSGASRPSTALVMRNVSGVTYPCLQYTANVAATDVRREFQNCDGSGTANFATPTPVGSPINGQQTYEVCSLTPVSAAPSCLFRIAVTVP